METRESRKPGDSRADYEDRVDVRGYHGGVGNVPEAPDYSTVPERLPRSGHPNDGNGWVASEVHSALGRSEDELSSIEAADVFAPSLPPPSCCRYHLSGGDAGLACGGDRKPAEPAPGSLGEPQRGAGALPLSSPVALGFSDEPDVGVAYLNGEPVLTGDWLRDLTGPPAAPPPHMEAAARGAHPGPREAFATDIYGRLLAADVAVQQLRASLDRAADLHEERARRCSSMAHELAAALSGRERSCLNAADRKAKALYRRQAALEAQAALVLRRVCLDLDGLIDRMRSGEVPPPVASAPELARREQ